MNQCSICLHLLSDEADRCPSCDTPLEEEEWIRLDASTTWEEVRVVTTAVEAHLIAGRLRSEGIPAFVLSQVDSTRNLTVGALAIARVYVPEQLLARADDLLRQPPELPWEGEE